MKHLALICYGCFESPSEEIGAFQGRTFSQFRTSPYGRLSFPRESVPWCRSFRLCFTRILESSTMYFLRTKLMNACSVESSMWFRLWNWAVEASLIAPRTLYRVSSSKLDIRPTRIWKGVYDCPLGCLQAWRWFCSVTRLGKNTHIFSIRDVEPERSVKLLIKLKNARCARSSR